MTEKPVTYFSSRYIVNHDYKRFTKDKGIGVLEDQDGIVGK
jgi:hypothetical protein